MVDIFEDSLNFQDMLCLILNDRIIVRGAYILRHILRKKDDKWTLSVVLDNVYYKGMLTATKQFLMQSRSRNKIFPPNYL